MSLHFSAAHSSRVKKPTSNLRRNSGLTSSTRKTNSKKRPLKEADEEDDDEFDARLEDHGLITALTTDLNLRDVAQQLRYVVDHAFDEIPERAGMNSTRIAEVLNFRRWLPPIVTASHIHALSTSPTATEREIAELVRAGVVRKISIPGRGVGAAALGDCLVLTARWVDVVHASAGLDDATKQAYIAALHAHPASLAVPVTTFSPPQTAALVRAGLLTSGTTATSPSAQAAASAAMGTLASLSTAGSRAATGTLAAVGGASALHDAGGGGGGKGAMLSGGQELVFALPSMGAFLRLLESARTHLLALLNRMRFKEAPRDLLRERWDGSVSAAEGKKRKRGLEGAVLPANTKKWKQFYGLRFRWVLEECVGAGLVECFETGSVGVGVRVA